MTDVSSPRPRATLLNLDNQAMADAHVTLVYAAAKAQLRAA